MSRETSAKLIPGLEISAPEWFKRDDFCKWVKNKLTASWFRGDVVDEFSDVFTLFDHDSSPDEMGIPPYVWQEICKLAEEQEFSYGLIWIKPV